MAMNILFLARQDLYTNQGGDTVQIDSTAKYLRKLGIEVEIQLSTDKIIYSKYDLLHFFNIIDPEDILGHAMKCNKPYLISTIYVDYSEYDKNHRKDLVGRLSKVLSYNTIEFAKTVGKYLLKGEKISTRKYFLKGHSGSIRYLLKNAACLLPNSHNEYNRLVNDYRIDKKYFAIPNAIDKEVFFNTERQTDRNLVLCVARIEGRKNQLNL